MMGLVSLYFRGIDIPDWWRIGSTVRLLSSVPSTGGSKGGKEEEETLRQGSPIAATTCFVCILLSSAGDLVTPKIFSQPNVLLFSDIHCVCILSPNIITLHCGLITNTFLTDFRITFCSVTLVLPYLIMSCLAARPFKCSYTGCIIQTKRLFEGLV